MDPLEELYYALENHYHYGFSVDFAFKNAGSPDLFKCPSCGAYSTELQDSCPRPGCTDVVSIQTPGLIALADLTPATKVR